MGGRSKTASANHAGRSKGGIVTRDARRGAVRGQTEAMAAMAGQTHRGRPITFKSIGERFGLTTSGAWERLHSPYWLLRMTNWAAENQRIEKALNRLRGTTPNTATQRQNRAPNRPVNTIRASTFGEWPTERIKTGLPPPPRMPLYPGFSLSDHHLDRHPRNPTTRGYLAPAIPSGRHPQTPITSNPTTPARKES